MNWMNDAKYILELNHQVDFLIQDSIHLAIMVYMANSRTGLQVERFGDRIDLMHNPNQKYLNCHTGSWWSLRHIPLSLINEVATNHDA